MRSIEVKINQSHQLIALLQTKTEWERLNGFKIQQALTEPDRFAEQFNLFLQNGGWLKEPEFFSDCISEFATNLPVCEVGIEDFATKKWLDTKTFFIGYNDTGIIYNTICTPAGKAFGFKIRRNGLNDWDIAQAVTNGGPRAGYHSVIMKRLIDMGKTWHLKQITDFILNNMENEELKFRPKNGVNHFFIHTNQQEVVRLVASWSANSFYLHVYKFNDSTFFEFTTNDRLWVRNGQCPY